MEPETPDLAGSPTCNSKGSKKKNMNQIYENLNEKKTNVDQINIMTYHHLNEKNQHWPNWYDDLSTHSEGKLSAVVVHTFEKHSLYRLVF